MKKKILTLLLAAAVTASLAGCAKGGDNAGADDATTIKVGANITPHSEILEQAKPILAEKGINLEIIQLEDSITPNTGVIDGSLDANYFQHVPYLEQFNEENGSDLVSIGAIHYEPFGVYAGRVNDLKDLPDGALVAVPNNVTNEARALQLLAANGVITLKDGVGLEATKLDIVDNPKNIEIVELEAATIPASLPDLAIGVINANYALGAGLTTDDAVAYEAADSEAAETYVNVIVVNAGNENSEKTQALVKAIQTDAVKDFILNTYNGAVQPKF